MVKVDAHSSSPVFIEDQKNGAYAMFDRGVIDGEALLEAEQPQNLQELIAKWKVMQAQRAKAAEEQRQTEAAAALQNGGGSGTLSVVK